MPKADHFAVVIGIALYPGFDEEKDLGGPVKDANAYVDWLKKTTGGDLPYSNIQQALSPQPTAGMPRPAIDDAHPDAEDVDALFRPLYKQGQDARVGERLYIIVAGHGMSDRTDLHSAALLAANATPSDPLHVAMVKRADWFRRHAAFDEIVLFVDCCRDNIGYELRPPKWPERWSSGPAHPRASKVRYLYGFATGYGKQSRERDFGSGETRGIFSQAVLSALTDAKPDAAGRITGKRLQDHVHNVHQSIAGDTVVEPPTFDDSDATMVFSNLPAPTTHAVQVWIQPHTGRDTLVVSQNFNTVKRIRSAASPQILTLVPGIYKLEIGGTDRKQLIEVPRDNECTL